MTEIICMNETCVYCIAGMCNLIEIELDGNGRCKMQRRTEGGDSDGDKSSD